MCFCNDKILCGYYIFDKSADYICRGCFCSNGSYNCKLWL
ncbi:hypothetical protein HMPREF0372_01139 [Flavonifractor plautii ATCC 29863]|uniref:Uncharacterized protein n=1 Tax=Flavonifractor plautii ATCC 29863 TaxID=411475 RepID=G9YNR2_FLAPL|nr:hypothetical protein HMPREF0372_01139 [Flavonifractor plautii ATCC 29863]